MGEACRPIHRRSASDEEDWRMPHGKRPPAAEINWMFTTTILKKKTSSKNHHYKEITLTTINDACKL